MSRSYIPGWKTLPFRRRRSRTSMLWKMIKKQRLRWGQFLPSIPFSANQDTHRTSQAAIEDIENASSTVKGWRGRCLASQGTYSVHSKSCDIWTRVVKHRYFQSPAYFPFMTSMTALSQVCNESKRQLKKQRKKGQGWEGSCCKKVGTKWGWMGWRVGWRVGWGWGMGWKCMSDSWQGYLYFQISKK